VRRRLERLRVLRPSNPKRPAGGASTEAWYSYYAGYADQFVREIVGALPDDTGRILDPWNGSGTTTSVATAHGLQSWGFDLNPAAVTIAKARLLRSDVGESVAPLTDEIAVSAIRGAAPVTADDPLRGWFDPDTAATLRALERRTYRLLVSSDDDRRLVDHQGLNDVSSLAALFYLGLFRTVRPLVEGLIGSNPTWIRRSVGTADRISVDSDTLIARFKEAMGSLSAAVRDVSFVYENGCPSRIAVGDSSAMPIDDDSVDAVITSPPYCTRIDYVVATRPELAVLGLSDDELRALRDRMIGTPTMNGEVGASLGAESTSLLARIGTHNSRASAGYYRKFYAQYLRGMARSIAEIDRTARAGAPVVLVAQDSYYKDIHVDVPSLLAEMGVARGWDELGRHRFAVPPNRNYAAIHGRARAYRASTTATETVLIFST
jgi:hypothetical protein